MIVELQVQINYMHCAWALLLYVYLVVTSTGLLVVVCLFGCY